MIKKRVVEERGHGGEGKEFKGMNLIKEEKGRVEERRRIGKAIETRAEKMEGGRRGGGADKRGQGGR